jgi:succinate dehydrogenase hydrophobic anchor subunit
MARPYVSTRTGSGQWIMQRVSAALLIILAFVHFGLQHFTSDAVSTGLTVATRFNNPWWQGYYILFIALALYHGVNGVVGIVRDFRPNTVVRVTLETALWSLAVFFTARGIINIATPRPLGEIKTFYALNGFPAGDSAGSPPAPGGTKHYDFRDELRELHLLAYYLERHTHRTEAQQQSVAEIFSGSSADDVAGSGKSFDTWLQKQIAAGPVSPDNRARESCFSSTHEFAVWAASVRMANLKFHASNPDIPMSTITEHALHWLVPPPPYDAAGLH